MDLHKIIFELRQRLKEVDDVIQKLEAVAAARRARTPIDLPRKRGRPRKNAPPRAKNPE
jgi:hypothetical protein